MKRTELKRKTPLGRGGQPGRGALPRGQLKQGSGRLRQSAIKPMSDSRRAENIERREALMDAFGQYPPCYLCEPLAAAGIRTGCNGQADDADEILRRSAGGSIVEPYVNGKGNVRPVGRRCHDWVTTHPRQARALGLELRPKPKDP